MIEISLSKFQQTRHLLKNKVLESPLIPLLDVYTSQQQPIFLKVESLQPSGSFKIRGASYCLSQLSPTQKAAGVVAYSTGNHAQAVALSARDLGIKATIVMSPNTRESKVLATRQLGAEIIFIEPEKRLQFTEEFARSTGAYLVPPFDHIGMMTGEGVIGLEILDQMTPSAIFVPVGGGGLIASIALAVKQIQPKVKIIGVEPELEDDAYRSFMQKKHLSINHPSQTLADAVRIPSLGNLTYPIVMNYVDAMTTVNEKQIAEATLLIANQAHLIVEPSGALALAGALKNQAPLNPHAPVVCLASGGNITLSDLCAIQAQVG